MSANLPSRGNRQQGPGGREVQQATAPGTDHGGDGRSSQGPGGRGVVRADPAGAGRTGSAEQPASQRRASQRPAAGGGVTQGELGTDAAGGGPSDSDRRRLRTQRALRSPRAVRQAILLRELLGPPVALRRHREDHPSLSD